jgi:hypothetical protein
MAVLAVHCVHSCAFQSLGYNMQKDTLTKTFAALAYISGRLGQIRLGVVAT